MWLLLMEAGVALLLLVLIVWWTMFAGPKPPPRPLRELPNTDRADDAAQLPPGNLAASAPENTSDRSNNGSNSV